jgi:hypothetical protein
MRPNNIDDDDDDDEIVLPRSVTTFECKGVVIGEAMKAPLPVYDLDEEVRKIDSIIGGETPITEEWLKANKFQLVDNEQLRSRRLSGDLSLEVDRVRQNEEDWFCWLVNKEPVRHIHIRYLKYVEELILLCEALTGIKWEEQNEH